MIISRETFVWIILIDEIVETKPVQKKEKRTFLHRFISCNKSDVTWWMGRQENDFYSDLSVSGLFQTLSPSFSCLFRHGRKAYR